MTFSNYEYRRIADEIDRNADWYKLDWSEYWNNMYEFSDAEIKPKQRARAGKGGRHYTPKETKDLEKTIKEWGYDCGMVPVSFPIGVDLEIRDYTDDHTLREHGLMGVVYYQKKDLDNMGKLVMDALNGVLYRDDRQVVDLRVRRRYSLRNGFKLVVWRAGFSASEYNNLKKFL